MIPIHVLAILINDWTVEIFNLKGEGHSLIHENFPSIGLNKDKGRGNELSKEEVVKMIRGASSQVEK